MDSTHGASGLPAAVQLGLSKPSAVKVYRQRVETPVLNAPNDGIKPNSTINIGFNTAQINTMLDPLSTLYQFTLRISNDSPFIDYASFGPEGVASLISSFALTNQGQPLELIERYGLVSRCFNFLSGKQLDEFEAYRESRFIVGGDHPGALKPPMTDAQGGIMGVLHSEMGMTTTGTNLDKIMPEKNNMPDSYRGGVFKYKEKMGRARLQDYFQYLANVKNLPIGLYLQKNQVVDQSGVKTAAQTVTNAAECIAALKPVRREWRVSIPPLSGIIGQMASKMVPTGLISAHAFTNTLVLESSYTPFSISMDPCRRIPFIRDYNLVSIDDTDGLPGSIGSADQYIMAVNAPGKSMNEWTSGSSNGTSHGQFGKESVINFDPDLTEILYGQNSGSLALIHMGCYGTKLPMSRPQTARMNFKAEKPETNRQASIEKEVTWSIHDFKFIYDEVVLPDALGSQIVSQSMGEGGIQVRSKSVRTYRLNPNVGADQTIIVPAKVGSADSLIFAFRDNRQVSGKQALYYDSNGPINIFRSVSTPAGSTYGIDKRGIGSSNPITYKEQDKFSMHLRIGNDYLPIQPIRDYATLETEMIKCQHGLNDLNTVMNINGMMCGSTYTTDGATGADVSWVEEGGYFTPFIPQELCDDQVSFSLQAHINYEFPGGSGGSGVKQYYVPGVFKPPAGNAFYCFNLNSWMGVSGNADNGMFLSNNVISLLLSGAEGLGVSGQSYVADCIIPHDMSINYLPGGQMIYMY